MTDPKRSTSMSKLLSIGKSLSVSHHAKTNFETERDTAEPGEKNKTGSLVSPKMLSNLKKGLKSFGKEKKKSQRNNKPFLSSITSDITCNDFDAQSLSGLTGFSGQEDADDNDVIPLPLSLQRAVSLDSDAKPLRPYRRGSSVESDENYLDYKEPSKRDARGLLACSSTSSITFHHRGGLLDDDDDDDDDFRVPLPPSFQRSLSLDSDCKPLRPLRRDSGILPKLDNDDYDDLIVPPTPRFELVASLDSDSKPLRPLRRESGILPQLGYDNLEYPEPGRRTASLDCLPTFPYRKSSMDFSCKSTGSAKSRDGEEPSVVVPIRKEINNLPHVKRRNNNVDNPPEDSLPNIPFRKKSMDVSSKSNSSTKSGEEPSAPNRKAKSSLPHVKRRTHDTQPSIPGRKSSLSHRCMLLDDDEEDKKDPILDKETVIDKTMDSSSVERASVTSASA